MVWAHQHTGYANITLGKMYTHNIDPDQYSVKSQPQRGGTGAAINSQSAVRSLVPPPVVSVSSEMTGTFSTSDFSQQWDHWYLRLWYQSAVRSLAPFFSVIHYTFHMAMPQILSKGFSYLHIFTTFWSFNLISSLGCLTVCARAGGRASGRAGGRACVKNPKLRCIPATNRWKFAGRS